MAQEVLIADGSTSWYLVKGNEGVGLAGNGDFGSGTVTLQYYIDGAAQSILNDSNAALTHTASFTRNYPRIRKGMVVRATLAGSTDPDLNIQINGDVVKVIR